MIDTFSPAWMAGYVIGRRPHGPSELPPARDRATKIGGAESFDDGYETGRAAAGRLPHRAVLRGYWLRFPKDGEAMQIKCEDLNPGIEAGLFTGDPVYLEGTDHDGLRLWDARGRLESSDLDSNRATVYIESVFQ